MKSLLIALLLLSSSSQAGLSGASDVDIYDSSGNALDSTAGSLNVNITGGGGGGGTVDQGSPGPSPWPVEFLSPQSVTGTFWQTTQPVSGPLTDTQLRATPPRVLSTLADSSGTALVNLNTNVAAIAGTTPDVGNGTSGSGTQRVAIASNQTPFLLKLADSSGTAISNSNALAVNVQNIPHVVVDTAPSTAVTNAGTFAVQAAQSGGWLMKLADASGTFLATLPVSLASAPTTAVTMAASSISGSNPCINPTATLVSITGATSTTNATQIIALSGSTKIYICSLTIIGVSGTNPTFSLVQGTGSNCVTGQTTVVQAFTTTANQSYLFAGPAIAVGVAGNELCFKDGGTSPVQNYQITYVQQ